MKRASSSGSCTASNPAGRISPERLPACRRARRALSLAVALLALGATSRAVPAALSQAGQDGSWLDLAPPPDDDAKVDPGGRAVVYLDALDGRGPAELWSLSFALDHVTRLSGAMTPEDRIWAYVISPDGRWVGFTASSSDGPRRLFLAPIGGGTPVRVDDERFPLAQSERFAFRPDSRAIGFRSGPERAVVVVLMEELCATCRGTSHHGK